MTSKKSIFERLGLVEAVEEDHVEANEMPGIKEGFFLDPEDDEVNAEFEAMLSEQNSEDYEMQNEYYEEQEPVVVNQPVNELMRSSVNEFTVNDQEPENTSMEIEDKLNVLIGAYEKNKLLSIEDIYRNSRLTTDSKRSIFIADVFLKTLPENLPVDIKRNSLLNILNVSAINIEELLTDAFQRIDSLNTVLENTVNGTEDLVKKNEMSIRELEARIEELRHITEIRRKFQEDQNTLIEYEIQRIINIVDFIKPKK